MLPLRLVLKNFLPYMSPEPVRFEGIHLACLVGPNGAGKSSLLDAITWALWGSARAKRDNDLIFIGQREMSIQLDFEQEGQIYQVIRKRERHVNQGGTSRLELLVKDETGQFLLISEPTILATQKRIDRLLRLDYETFCNSAFLQQGKADAFTTKTPKERKQILSDILGLAQWERYEAHTKVLLKTISDDLMGKEHSIREIDAELETEPALRDAFQAAIEQQQRASDALQAARQSAAEVEDAPILIRSARQQLAERQASAVRGQMQLQTTQAQINRHRERIAHYNTLIARQDDIEKGYAALQSARESDFELGEKLRLLKEMDVEQHNLEMELEQARSTLREQARIIEGRISGLERTVNQNDVHALEAVQAEIAALNGLNEQRGQLHDQLQRLGEQRGELEATNKSLHAEMNRMKDRLDRLQTTVDATCPLCGQPLDDEHLHSLVEQLTGEGKQRGDQFRANQAQMKKLSAQISAVPQQIAELDAQIGRVQGLMARAGALQAQLDAATAAASELEEETAQLNAVQHTLASEAFGQELRSQIAAINARRIEVNYDDSTHHAARKQLNLYRTYEAHYHDLHSAQQALPEAQLSLQESCERLEQTQRELEADNQHVIALESEIAQLEADVETYLARQAQVLLLTDAESKAREALIIARQELDTLDKQRVRRADLEAKAQKKREEEALYDALRVAFSKNGIPAMIIETAIPELEISANTLLTRMTGGRMNLAFHTQREKVTGGLAETLEIQISDELGTRSYEMYSGGEAFRINFAIRVALSQLLARRAGAHLRTLFIDEGFGTQDEEGRNRLVEAITAIQDDFDMILVVTHIDELRDSFPVHIVVEKESDGSHVSVR
jgi:exonuclease SbcC